MSSQKDAYGRSRDGAHGDRRQQPALTKKLSGIRSKMHILRKNSSSNLEVDEKEWNQRMQTWEKKRERLLGSDWDRSFREAVHARLKSKKPWRTPTSSRKASLHKADRKSNAPENENNCWSSANKLENFATIDANFVQKNGHQNSRRKEDGKIEAVSLEVIGLKRENSRMELDLTAVVQSGVYSMGVQAESPKDSKNLQSSKEKANIIISETSERANDAVLTRTNSLILFDAKRLAQSSTRFVKTVLSPIQSESDCSKQGADVQSGDGQNMLEGTTDTDENKQPAGNGCTQSLDIMKDHGINSITEMSSGEPNICRKEPSQAVQNLPSEQSPLQKNLDEYETKIDLIESRLLHQCNKNLHSNQETQNSREVPQGIRELIKTNETTRNDEEPLNSSSQKTNHSSQTTLQHQTKVDQKIDKSKANEEGNEKASGQQRNSKIKAVKNCERKKESKKNSKKDVTEAKKSSETHNETNKVNNSGSKPHQQDRLKGELTMELSRGNNLGDSYTEEKTVKNYNKVERRNGFSGHDVQVPTPFRSFSPKTVENEGVVTSNILSRCSRLPSVQELSTSKSEPGTLPKTHFGPIAKEKMEDERKPRETLHNSSSLTYTNTSKERMIHAILSSPDTEIFGSHQKKPPAQPVFIRTVLSSDNAPVDSQMVIVECISQEPFELRAKPRPLSDESLMLLDESAETLSTNPGDWYKEFQSPVVSSEEFEPDQKKPDCYREIIIDRSGCRILYDGTCHGKLSRGLEKRCVRHYEVCHDTSRCSLKNNMKRKRQVHCANHYKSIHEASSVESWYSTD